jgi:hypothetical protein
MRRGLLGSFWASALSAAVLLGYGAASGSFITVVLGAVLACLAFASGTLAGLVALPQQSGFLKILTGTVDRAHPGDPDLLFDLDAVEVAGVYLLARHLMAYLRSDGGFCGDDLARGHGGGDVGYVYLTWRCAGRGEATRLARQLNAWQISRTPLRLLAAKGRCAVLMEDERRWLTLPELAAAGR